MLPTPGRRRPGLIRLAQVIVLSLALLLAARSMPADAWFVSDPGAKFVATRAVLAHPGRPLVLDMRALPPEARATNGQPFFALHDGHAHAITSQLFPLLTAPFLALFGLPGLYVWPALSWVLTVMWIGRLARTFEIAADEWLVLTAAALGTPLIFYALEFWEHMPTVAFLTLGMTLAFTASMRARIGAGLCWAIAFQLRPEAAWSAAAVTALLWYRKGGLSVWPIVAGGIAGIAPLAAFNLHEAGSLGSPHLTANLGGVANDWLGQRIAYARVWLEPHRSSTWMLLGALAATHLLTLSKRVHVRRAGVVLGWVIVLVLAREAGRGRDIRESLLRVFPLGIAALAPQIGMPRRQRELWFLIGLPLVATLATAPNDGGGQWGPRYLLPIVPAVLLLAMDKAGGAIKQTRVAWVVAGLLLLFGSLATRSAYREVRGVKEFYDRLAHQTLAASAGAARIVTDVWWVPTAHAAVIDTNRLLYLESPASGSARLLTRGAPSLLVTGAKPTSESIAPWITGTCYRAGTSTPSEEQLLWYTPLRCGG